MTAGSPLSAAILSAIVEASLSEVDGARVCHIDATAVLDAFSIISAWMIATSPEAKTADGLKRVLRRQARQLERQVGEFRHHSAEHGSPFVVSK